MMCDFCMVDFPPVVVNGVGSYPEGYDEALNATVVVESVLLPNAACLCSKHEEVVRRRDPTARITGDIVHKDGTAHITTRAGETKPCIKLLNASEALEAMGVKVPKA